MAIWVHSLVVRIDNAKKALDQMNFIPEHEKHAQVVEKYQKLEKNLDNYIAKQNFEDFMESIKEMKEGENIDHALMENYLKEESVTDKEDDGKVAHKGKDGKGDKKQREQKILKSNFNTQLLKIMIEVQYWNKLQGAVTIPHALARLSGEQDRLRILRENVMLIVRDYNDIMMLINDTEQSLFEEHLVSLTSHYKQGINKFNWSQQQDVFILNCRKECQVQSRKIKLFQEKD